MTSSIIALPLLLTPALKNNIWQACHDQAVAVHCLGLCSHKLHLIKKKNEKKLSSKVEKENLRFPQITKNNS